MVFIIFSIAMRVFIADEFSQTIFPPHAYITYFRKEREIKFTLEEKILLFECENYAERNTAAANQNHFWH